MCFLNKNIHPSQKPYNPFFLSILLFPSSQVEFKLLLQSILNLLFIIFYFNCSRFPMLIQFQAYSKVIYIYIYIYISKWYIYIYNIIYMYISHDIFIYNTCYSMWLRWYRICLQCGRPEFHPWLGKIPWIREWLHTPVFLPGEFHGQRSLVGYSPWDSKESNKTEKLTHTHVCVCINDQ